MCERGELGECPFCGENALGGHLRVEVQLKWKAPPEYYIECDVCEFRGPLYSTAEEAESAWQEIVGRKLASWDDLLAACEFAQDSGVDAVLYAQVTAAITKAREVSNDSERIGV